MQSASYAKAFLDGRRARWLSYWAAVCFTSGLLVFAAQRHWLGLDASALPPVWRGSFPSFVHTYVFVLVACAWVAHSWSQAVGLGLLFWGVDVLVEVLQLPQLHVQWGTGVLLRSGLISTFDWNDLAALTLGLCFALCTLAWAQRHSCRELPA